MTLRSQINDAKGIVASEPAVAARILATVHRQAGEKIQRECESLVAAFSLWAYVRKVGSCLVPR